MQVLIHNGINFDEKWGNLLEVGSESVKILVVRKQGVSLGAEEVVVPNAQNRQNYRNLTYKRKEGLYNYMLYAQRSQNHRNQTKERKEERLYNDMLYAQRSQNHGNLQWLIEWLKENEHIDKRSQANISHDYGHDGHARCRL